MPPPGFTPEQDALLMAEMKKNPFLYVKSHHRYRNYHDRENWLETVATTLEKDGVFINLVSNMVIYKECNCY